MLAAALATAAVCATLPEVRHDAPVVESRNGVLDVVLEYGAARLALPGGKHVTARCYNGSVPGPQLRVRPGDVLRIKLINTLGSQTWANDCMNEYRLPNTTNLHTHGLHVSPIAPGDETRVAVNPGGSYQYEYVIPEDHAPGIHWYHPHFHGSAALQVFTGGYGLIEVVSPDEGVLATLPTAVLPVQFLHFSGEDSQTLSSTSIMKLANISKCDMVGKNIAHNTLPDVDTWLVNGVSMPTVRMTQCAATRFRVVFAAAGSELFLKLVHPEPQRCGACSISLAARDGHQLARFPRPIDGPAYIPPGGRADLIVRCPDACDGYVLTNVLEGDLADPSDDHVKPLAYVNVLPTKHCADAVPPLSWTRAYETSYTPDLTQEVVPAENAVDMVLIDGTGCRYQTASASAGAIDDWFRMKARSDTRAVMHLGTTYEVKYSQDTRHPYHQHVYPFQVVSGTTYAAAGNFEAGDYMDSAMFWNATFRFRPHRFAGIMMFHCHLLGHEDQGCMAQFDVRPRAVAAGGVSVRVTHDEEVSTAAAAQKVVANVGTHVAKQSVRVEVHDAAAATHEDVQQQLQRLTAADASAASKAADPAAARQRQRQPLPGLPQPHLGLQTLLVVVLGLAVLALFASRKSALGGRYARMA